MAKGTYVFGILILLIMVVIGAIGWQAYNRETGGFAAHEFTLPRMDQAGALTLADYRGRVVVLNFWASWCTPCREEAPRLVDVSQEYDEQEVIFIGVNSYEDSSEGALAFLDEFGIPYANVLDADNAIARQYNVYALPVTAIIDQNGYIRDVFFRSPARAELRNAIEEVRQN